MPLFSSHSKMPSTVNYFKYGLLTQPHCGIVACTTTYFNTLLHYINWFLEYSVAMLRLESRTSTVFCKHINDQALFYDVNLNSELMVASWLCQCIHYLLCTQNKSRILFLCRQKCRLKDEGHDLLVEGYRLQSRLQTNNIACKTQRGSHSL